MVRLEEKALLIKCFIAFLLAIFQLYRSFNAILHDTHSLQLMTLLLSCIRTVLSATWLSSHVKLITKKIFGIEFKVQKEQLSF